MSDPFCPQKLRNDVIHYASLGEHRSASAADLATSQWIQSELRQSGVSAELDPWKLSQFNLQECWVEVFGKRFEAFPLWYPTPLGDEPCLETLVTDDQPVDGKVVLTRFDDRMVTRKSDHAGKVQSLADAGARAIIGCTPHESGEIYGQNVIPPFNQLPWPVPVLMVRPSDQHVLQNAAKHGDQVRICLSGTQDQNATAHNVVGKSVRGRQWIIVSTPQSGWFRCAGERGAGVALLLALARWQKDCSLPCSFMFLSNSGHEIGHMGIDHLLKNERPPAPEETACWLHLGASVGTIAYRSDEAGFLSHSGPETENWLFAAPTLQETLGHCFEGFEHLTPKIYDRKNGEIRWILENGYAGFALMGPQRFFHLAGDGPENVDTRLLSDIGKAITEAFHAVVGAESNGPGAQPASAAAAV